MAQLLVTRESTLSGRLEYGTVSARVTRGNLRTRARRFSDRYFAAEGNEPSDYFGTFYRYYAERNVTVTGFLTRKEALFGEYGEPNHEPLVRFEVVGGDQVEVSYQDLTTKDFDYLTSLLTQMGLVKK